MRHYEGAALGTGTGTPDNEHPASLASGGLTNALLVMMHPMVSQRRRCNTSALASAAGGPTTNDDYVLTSLLRGAGAHSVLRHDVVVDHMTPRCCWSSGKLAIVKRAAELLRRAATEAQHGQWASSPGLAALEL